MPERPPAATGHRLASGARRTAAALGRLAHAGRSRRGRRTEVVTPDTARTASYSYSPAADGRADPGEVVWARVPFEEDPRRGKDRPVLVVGRDGDRLLALQLTSKDHDLDAEQEEAAGRHWVDVGSGAWDHRGRESEARVNRLLRLEPSAVRRAGAALDRRVFDTVLAEVRRFFPEP